MKKIDKLLIAALPYKLGLPAELERALSGMTSAHLKEIASSGISDARLGEIFESYNAGHLLKDGGVHVQT